MDITKKTIHIAQLNLDSENPRHDPIENQTEQAHSMLNNIASSLRHSEPDDVTIHLDGGGSMVGNDLKIYGKKQVVSYNGIVDSMDLYRAMHEWLMQKIGENEVI